MKIIQPDTGNHNLTELTACKNAIFLAGPCPRDNYENDWRNEAIEILKKLKFNGIVINPTNPNYDELDKEYLAKQTKWETEGLFKASAIVFWIERSEEHPAFTTNIEFGQWFDKQNVYCGWSRKAIKNRYLEEKLKSIGKKKYSSLEVMLAQVVVDLNRPSKKWFLSDTHFGQQRTLELSKRPFRNINEMDLTMISNWNKNITINDEVYFLGDFGENFDYLNLLNFGTLHFVLGNYERLDQNKKDITTASIAKLAKFKNVKTYLRGDCKVKLKNEKEVICIHEPIDPEEKDPTNYTDQLCIYGHIHGRQFYKLNGTDAGVDIHQFTPMDEDEIIWRLNAIKYLDQNVWNLNCI